MRGSMTREEEGMWCSGDNEGNGCTHRCERRRRDREKRERGKGRGGERSQPSASSLLMRICFPPMSNARPIMGFIIPFTVLESYTHITHQHHHRHTSSPSRRGGIGKTHETRETNLNVLGDGLCCGRNGILQRAKQAPSTAPHPLSPSL